MSYKVKWGHESVSMELFGTVTKEDMYGSHNDIVNRTRQQSPTLETLWRLSDYLNVSPSQLTARTEELIKTG